MNFPFSLVLTLSLFPSLCLWDFPFFFTCDAVLAMRIRSKHFCAVVAEPFESKTNRVHIRFYANKDTVNSTFSIYYSTFRKKRGSCEAHELDCEDDTCIISDGLKCNNKPNCKFQKDEENCPLVRTKKALRIS